MKKNKGHRACICGRAADSAYHLHFLHWKILKKMEKFDFMEFTLRQSNKDIMWKRWSLNVLKVVQHNIHYIERFAEEVAKV